MSLIGPSPSLTSSSLSCRQDIQNLRLENELLERRLLAYEGGGGGGKTSGRLVAAAADDEEDDEGAAILNF